MMKLHPKKARRHESTKAQRGRSGFSLIAVLLAVLILGVGVISSAALFPAGIVQQRLSVDDGMGPRVANNALSILRSKLKQDDFGYFFTAPVPPNSHPT